MTQDSFSRVEGLVTSIQIHSANMDEALESSTEILSQSFMQLQLYCEQHERAAADIRPARAAAAGTDKTILTCRYSRDCC